MSDEKTAAAIEEVWKLFRETDARFKETDARLDQRFQETNARFKETDAQLRRLEGMFGIQWGRLLEALVEPAALQLFRERGIDVHRSSQRQKSRVNGRTMELDIVLENEHDAVVIKVKSLVKPDDVIEFLADLEDIALYFPRLAQQRVVGAIAGLEYASEADRYAYKQGLFVLALSGEGVVRILNDASFRPADFGQQSP